MTPWYPRWFRASMFRLAGAFRRGAHERAIADELESHLQMHIDDNLRAGMTPEQARRHAVLKLGGVEASRQAYRDRSGVPWLEHVLQDGRFAARQLRKSPGFAATAVVILALGLGMSAAIFAFVDAALLRPLPYKDPARLVYVTEATPQIPRAALSYLDYVDWKRLNTVFSSLAVYNYRGYTLSTPAGAEFVRAARVSDNFFRTLGVAPVLGRDFRAGEDAPSAPPSLLLSHSAWHSRFGAQSDVIGRSITLGGISHTIVGVLPEDFRFAPTEFWTTLQATGPCETRRSCHNLQGIARLEEGVSVGTALAEMTTIAGQLEQQYPDSNRDQRASVVPLAEVVVGNVRPVLLVLIGGAALLLLIACVNVASLLLVRSESRRRELAVRRALGASRARLVGQFVTESFVLVGLGCAFGLAAAHWAIGLLVGLIPADLLANMPYLHRLSLNAHVLAYVAVVSLLAAAMCALTPALRIPKAEERASMADAGRGSTGTTWHRLGFKLVVVELAMAMVLLAGAGLLGRSFYNLLHVDLGFVPDRLAVTRVIASRASYGDDDRAVALGRRVVARAASLPGVTSAAIVSVPPVSFNGNTDWIRFVGRPYNGEHNEVNQRDVSSDYFATLRTRLLRGRYFTDEDDASRPKVVVINQTLARMYFPNEDPIGKRIGDTSLSPDSIKEIVGVVDDIHEGALDAEIWPAVYYPFNQGPDSSFVLLVRTEQTEASLLPALSKAVRELDPAVATVDETTMWDRIQDSPAAYLKRSAARLVGAFAAAALFLGVVGLYGVIAYSVSQRTREIGTRIALGAQPATIYRTVLGEAGRLAGIGIAIGLACSVAAASLMQKLLFGTTPWDVPTLAVVAALLGGAALLASYFPARRAASVNPMEALRME